MEWFKWQSMKLWSIELSITNPELFSNNNSQNEQNTTVSVKLSSLFGGISKVLTSFTLFPLTVIRTRQQQFDKDLLKNTNLDKNTIVSNYKYGSFISTITIIYKNESIKGFYKGIVPSLIRHIPNSLLFFYSYEHMKQTLNSKLDNLQKL